MKTTISIISASALLWSASPQASAQLVAGNVRAFQRPNTKLVDIDYDVTGVTTPVFVALEISSDGGTTWSVPATTLTGAVGNNVTPGNNLRITWDAGTDWNGQVSTQTKFRVSVAGGQEATPAGMSLIPAGAFQMGDAMGGGYSSELPVHSVYVSGFYMAKYETTKELWDSVRAWGVANGYTDLAVGNYGYASKGASHPVLSITWYDMVKWCNARSEMEGGTPCYTVDGATYRTGQSAPTCNFAASGYRLPTEAEWEKAARGGLSGQNFPWGNTISHSQANYYSTSYFSYDVSSTRGAHPTYKVGNFSYTSPVGSFAPNGYGLYDMAGNLYEWCWDWYGSYSSASQSDPHGPSSGSDRVGRGGSWDVNADRCRVANRSWNFAPNVSGYGIGFRIARSSSGERVATTSDFTTLDTQDLFSLTSAEVQNGSITGTGSFAPNSSATLTAVPSPGYVFTSWTVDASGTTNPLTITMDANKNIGATFSPDLADDDKDTLTNFDELVTYGTDPLKADTDGDGFDDLFEVNTGFSPTSETSTPDAVSGMTTAVKFYFNAANGVSYRIEQSTDLETWTVLETGIVGTGGVVKRFYEIENLPKRYFRVRRE